MAGGGQLAGLETELSLGTCPDQLQELLGESSAAGASVEECQGSWRQRGQQQQGAPAEPQEVASFAATAGGAAQLGPGRSSAGQGAPSPLTMHGSSQPTEQDAGAPARPLPLGMPQARRRRSGALTMELASHNSGAPPASPLRQVSGGLADAAAAAAEEPSVLGRGAGGTPGAAAAAAAAAGGEPGAGAPGLSRQPSGQLLSGSEADELTCAICLDRTPMDELAIIKECSHSYCARCILLWASQRDVCRCPQCKTPFNYLLTYRSLDGTLNEFPQEESVVLLLRATWFLASVKQDGKGKAPVAGVEYAGEPASDWQDYTSYYAEYDDDEEVEAFYFSSAAGRAGIKLGNRRWGENGYVAAGRMQARPVAQPGKKGKGSTGGKGDPGTAPDAAAGPSGSSGKKKKGKKAQQGDQPHGRALWPARNKGALQETSGSGAGAAAAAAGPAQEQFAPGVSDALGRAAPAEGVPQPGATAKAVRGGLADALQAAAAAQAAKPGGRVLGYRSNNREHAKNGAAQAAEALEGQGGPGSSAAALSPGTPPVNIQRAAPLGASPGSDAVPGSSWEGSWRAGKRRTSKSDGAVMGSSPGSDAGGSKEGRRARRAARRAAQDARAAGSFPG